MPPISAGSVTVLGAGALGAAMASRLGETGHEVRLWNRTAEKARAVADQAPGVTAVDELGEAVSGAHVVITVLRDGDAVAQVMAAAIAELDESAVWVQASTVGPASARALADMAREHDVAYLDAPVSGSTAPARLGRLVWLVAGDDDVLVRVRPVLDALASAVLHVGTGVEGSSLKLAINAWMVASTVAISDVLALCDALDIDHSTFVEAIEARDLPEKFFYWFPRSALRLAEGAPHGRTFIRTWFYGAAGVEGSRTRRGICGPQPPTRDRP